MHGRSLLLGAVLIVAATAGCGGSGTPGASETARDVQKILRSGTGVICRKDDSSLDWDYICSYTQGLQGEFQLGLVVDADGVRALSGFAPADGRLPHSPRPVARAEFVRGMNAACADRSKRVRQLPHAVDRPTLLLRTAAVYRLQKRFAEELAAVGSPDGAATSADVGRLVGSAQDMQGAASHFYRALVNRDHGDSESAVNDLTSAEQHFDSAAARLGLRCRSLA